MPLVSVIVPMHNAERHLRQCLDSILAQSLTDFELIVVDDGSTDGSGAIAAGYAAGDPRVRVIPGPALGSAGAARNAGLDVAGGQWLSFLDADDFFDPALLETLYRRASGDGADIALCRFASYDDATGQSTPANASIRLEEAPGHTPFSPDEVGDHLFLFTNPAPWNKLFRRDFVIGSGLRFQHLRTTNDAYFVLMALAEASLITYTEEFLVSYRTGNTASLRGSLHEAPMDFVPALEAMRDRLRETGRFDRFERAFVNLAAVFCLYNLNRATTPESYLAVCRALQDGLLERFGILGRDPGYFLRPWQRTQLARLTGTAATDLLAQRWPPDPGPASGKGTLTRARQAVRRALRR